MIRFVSLQKPIVSCIFFAPPVLCIRTGSEYTKGGFIMKHNRSFYAAVSLLAAFILWTAAVGHVDVQPIGPLGSSVGFATLNRFFHNRTGLRMTLYTITDWLSLVPIGFAVGFAGLGLFQWIRRKQLRHVDRSLLILGCFYVVVMGIYILFEQLAVNYRPVLLNGALEVSYPSSTTLLVLCLMPTAVLQLRVRMRNGLFRQVLVVSMTAFTAFMLFGRLLSGVHWLTDIIGGVLLSVGLIMLYCFFVKIES